MMMKTSRRALLYTTSLAIVILAAFLASRWHTRNYFADILQIEHLPQSAENVDCTDYGFTDLLVRCSLKIEPADFPKLLTGYEFQTEKACGSTETTLCVGTAGSGMSHEYCCGPNTGENFRIDTIRTATPKNAPHGGLITVLNDAEEKRVMVALYIE